MEIKTKCYLLIPMDKSMMLEYSKTPGKPLSSVLPSDDRAHFHQSVIKDRLLS